MKYKLYKSMTGIALATFLTTSTVVPAFAANATVSQSVKAPTISNTIIGKVKIDSKSYFELHEVNILSNTSGKTVSFKVTVHNKSNKDILLIDYWVNLKSKTGSKFSVNLIPEDKTKARIPANSSQTLTYYSDISSNINLSGLRFEFIKWDFNQSGFERILGSLSVPTSYNASTPVNQKRTLNVNGTKILTSIDRVIMSKTEKFSKPSISFKLQNIGSQSFTVPAYEYKLVTSNGLVYPLSVVKGKENLVLNPKVTDTIQLTGSIPLEVASSGWKLLVTLPITDTKISLPISSYVLPPISQQVGGAIGKEYSFSNASGDYKAVLNSIHRLPQEDNDILAANITLSNPGSETVKIPSLLGEFVLDQNVKVTATAVRSDKSIGIPPKSSVSLQLYANIPYNYKFSEIRTVLQEKEEDDKIATLLEFVSSSELSSIKTIALNDKFKFDVIGKRADLSVRKIITYETDTANIFSVQMIAENLEKRFSNISALNAYFQTEDGLLYPASVELSDKKVSPDGIGLINFWKDLPKGIDTSKITIVVGEAVLGEDGKQTSNYVNPVAFQLPTEDKSVSSVLNNLDLYPYSISLSKIRTQINYEAGEMILSFNYDLAKEPSVEAKTEDHKLVLEVTDDKHKLKFSEEFLLETGEKALEIGTHEGKFSKSSSDLIFQIETLKDYNLNVYHQFKGHRTLLATKKIGWFTTTL